MVERRGRPARRPARMVKVDKDEVLLDIGYKSEGVIPSP
jgi:ribosomal protein S1